jgi:hypothetical protein
MTNENIFIFLNVFSIIKFSLHPLYVNDSSTIKNLATCGNQPLTIKVKPKNRYLINIKCFSIKLKVSASDKSTGSYVFST